MKLRDHKKKLCYYEKKKLEILRNFLHESSKKIQKSIECISREEETSEKSFKKKSTTGAESIDLAEEQPEMPRELCLVFQDANLAVNCIIVCVLRNQNSIFSPFNAFFPSPLRWWINLNWTRGQVSLETFRSFAFMSGKNCTWCQFHSTTDRESSK